MKNNNKQIHSFVCNMKILKERERESKRDRERERKRLIL